MAWHASYSLSRSEDRVDGRWMPRARDQRHAFYADLTYTPNQRWQVSAAWNFHSGWPTTESSFRVEPGVGGRPLVVPFVGPAYGQRLPDYHRLDLRVSRRIPTARGELRLHLDVFNAYDRENLLGYLSRPLWRGGQLEVVREPRAQLPLLPSVGATWEF